MPDEIKISQLPALSFPITGSESIPFVQSGTTKVGFLSSLNSYLSSVYLEIPSRLTVASTLIGNELISIQQNNNTRRISLSSLNSYLSSTYIPTPSSIAPSTSYTLPLPSNGIYLGEKKEYFIRPSASVDLSLNASIKIPSDSGLTLPKALTANELYIVVLRWNGTAWMLVSLVGGYA